MENKPTNRTEHGTARAVLRAASFHKAVLYAASVHNPVLHAASVHNAGYMQPAFL